MPRASLHTRIRVGALLLALCASLTFLIGATTSAASAATDPCGTGGNPITCENSKPGTPRSVWDIDGAGDSDIQGFATDISVNVGSTVSFKVDTTAKAYSIDIYRTGYYAGNGARKIASVTPTAALPQKQPSCITDASTELYDCGNWGVSASWAVPSTAVSGVYVAKLTRADNGDDSHITFIVRNDASHSDVVFQTADPTWEAYNTYGGSDFYQGAANGRAYKISYNRPFATRGGSYGRDFYFSAEYSMVRFMERNGYDVSYLAGVDSDRRGALLKNHKVFVSAGHDEYWSAAQRANVVAARDAGVNLMFLSGNEMYWHTRYEPSADSSKSPYRTLVSYKETWGNAKIDPTPEWTGTWRDPRFAAKSAGAGMPENGVTGTLYMSNDSDLPVTVSSDEGKLRLWRGTSLATLASGASAALAPHTIGYESDEDLDNGSRPAGLIHLSTTKGNVPQYLQDFGNVTTAGTTTHHLTEYRASSGALVFSAGSVQWAWGLDAGHDGAGTAAPADVRMQQAQVNLFADMGAQPASLASDLKAAAGSTDTVGPTTKITTPADGSSAANGTKVIATGTASDAAGQVAGVEVSTDGGSTWHQATGTSSWSYTYYQTGQGPTPLKARATDDSANIGAVTSISRPVSCPCSVYGDAAPAKADSGDASPVELGLRFSPTVDGYLSGVRFYKSTANTGTHVGTLWSSSGQQLAQATFSNETSSGWQSVSFAAPVRVAAGTTYVVSYSAPKGHYAVLSDDLWYRGIDASPLKVDGGDGSQAAGVYENPGHFTNLSFGRGQYYVDPVLTLTDTSPLTVSAQTPLAGSTSVKAGTTVTAQFNKAIDEASVAVRVKDPNGVAVAGATSYSSATRTVTFTPSSPLTGFVTYSVAVDAKDTAGRAVASGQTWSFTTAKPASAPGVCPCTLYDDSTSPDVLQASDPAAVTLGVTFSSKVDGTITAVRFYKGPGNTGSHTGSLWTKAGSVLASGTFTGESASGWQTLTFSQPVAVTAGTQYIAGYRAPVGSYSVTSSGLGPALDRSPLVTATNAGAYTYGAGAPTTSTSTSYLVDVVFQRQPAGISVSRQSPVPGAVDVDRTDPVEVTFSAAIKSGYTFSASASGSPVSGTTVLSGDGTTLTFTPAQALPASTQVTMSLSGVTSVDGATLASQSWSFTTGSTTPEPSETLFGPVTPDTPSTADSAPIEVGVAFSPTIGGKVTGIRFFKGAGNGGTHRGTLWSSAGQKLATVTFANESSTGWQTAKLATPVAVSSGQTYVVSYLAPQGHYASSAGFFANPWVSGHLNAPTSNGRYLYGADGGLPASTYGATNYFVDVTFVPNVATISVVGRSPDPGATGVDIGASPSITFSDPLKPGTSFSLSAGTTSVAGSTTLSSDGTTVSFDPTSSLAAGTTYTAKVSGATSTQGAVNPDQTWTFQTAATPEMSLFTGQLPATASTNDSSSIELGTAFSPQVSGQIISVRFYKGAGNTGTHVGTIWSSTGTALATVTFANETSTGWQSAKLSTPLDVTAGTSYVVSYLAPAGHYSSTGNFFSQPWTGGQLTAPSRGNGLYLYGPGGFPTQDYNQTNYFVDVGFRPAG